SGIAMVRLESAGGIDGTVILGRDPWAGPAPMKKTGPLPAAPPPLKTNMRGGTGRGRPRRLSGGRAWCPVLLWAPVSVYAASRQAAASAAAQRTAAREAVLPWRRHVSVPGWREWCSAAQGIGGLQQAGPQGGVQVRQQLDRRAGDGGRDHDARVEQRGPV